MEEVTHGWDAGGTVAAPLLQECRVLRIERGDIVVLETEQPLAPEMATAIKRQLEDHLAKAGHPSTPSMIISGASLVKMQIAAE